MRLSRAEKTAVIAALCFVVLLTGYLLGQGHVSGAFSVTASRGGAYDPVPSASAARNDAPQSTPEEVRSVFPIDINSATIYELTALPGIGESLAGRIVAYREENGAFSAIEDIMNVKGIGEAKFRDIKDKILAIGGAES